MLMISILTKTPLEYLDYEIDFAELSNGVPGATSDYLQLAEQIESYTLFVSEGLTIEDDQLVRSNTSILFWLRGGVLGKSYRLIATVVTTQARVVERYHVVYVRRKSGGA
jgi:hypothetical protein